MDENTLSLIIGFIGAVLGFIGLAYAIYCQKENMILQETIAREHREHKAQLDEVLISVSKANLQLRDLGLELIEFNNQARATKFPEEQQKGGIWERVWQFIIVAFIGFLIYSIFKYLTTPRKHR